ncbi:hypothetical protein D9M68_556680 [compost metagenome]
MRGFGDGVVERHVGGSRAGHVAMAVGLRQHGCERGADRVDIGRGAALGRHLGASGFDHAAQLEQLRQRGPAIRRACHAPGLAPRGFRNKGARALARDQHAVGLELGDGFAHDRPAHAEGVGQACFGGQASARGVAAGEDVVVQGLGEAAGQRGRAVQGHG